MTKLLKQTSDKLIKERKRKLARKFNLSYRYIDDLSLSTIKYLMNSSLISTQKNSPFLRLHVESISVTSYLDLLFTRDMTNVMRLASTLWTFPLCQAIFHQRQSTASMHLSSFAMPVVVKIIVTFYHATGPWWQDFCHRVTKLIVCPTHLRNSLANTLI